MVNQKGDDGDEQQAAKQRARICGDRDWITGSARCIGSREPEFECESVPGWLAALEAKIGFPNNTAAIGQRAKIGS